MMDNIKRGDIYIVNFDNIFPIGKHYQRGRRPCIVTSNNYNNRYSDLINVIPLTTKNKNLPQQLKVTSAYLPNKESYLLPESMTCIDKQYLEYKLGCLTSLQMQIVDTSIRIQNGDKIWGK